MLNRQSWVLLFIHFFHMYILDLVYFNTCHTVMVGIDNQRGLVSLESWTILRMGSIIIERKWTPLHSTGQCFLISILRLISLVSISFVIKLELWFPEVFVIGNEKTNLICFEDKSQHWVLAVCQYSVLHTLYFKS